VPRRLRQVGDLRSSEASKWASRGHGGPANRIEVDRAPSAHPTAARRSTISMPEYFHFEVTNKLRSGEREPRVHYGMNYVRADADSVIRRYKNRDLIKLERDKSTLSPSVSKVPRADVGRIRVARTESPIGILTQNEDVFADARIPSARSWYKWATCAPSATSTDATSSGSTGRRSRFATLPGDFRRQDARSTCRATIGPAATDSAEARHTLVTVAAADGGRLRSVVATRPRCTTACARAFRTSRQDQSRDVRRAQHFGTAVAPESRAESPRG
jgi:hypothetical protein